MVALRTAVLRVFNAKQPVNAFRFKVKDKTVLIINDRGSVNRFPATC